MTNRLPPKSKDWRPDGPGSRHLRRPSPRPLAEIVERQLEPLFARRAGLSVQLIEAWPQIAGPQYADFTSPEQIKWPRTANFDGSQKPGCLVIACDPTVVLDVQHETGEIRDRVNQFFGHIAIDSIKILQRAFECPDGVPESGAVDRLGAAEISAVERVIADIGDDQLKETLRKLGLRVYAKTAAPK